MKPDVLVLGAGMVGTCTALHLALRGHAVTLVDRREPGRETSYGNAGIIQREAVVPYAFPRQLSKLLGVAMKRGADVNYHLGALPGLAAPLSRYWRNSAPRRHAQLSQAYAALIEHSLHTHDELIGLAGAQDLVRREGYRWIFRTGAAMAAAVADAQRLAERHGLRHVVMDRDTLRPVPLVDPRAPFAGALVLMQGAAEIVRCIMCLKTGEWPERLKDVSEIDVVGQLEARHAATARSGRIRPGGGGSPALLGAQARLGRRHSAAQS